MNDLLALAWGDAPGHKCILAIGDSGVKPAFLKNADDAAEAARKLDEKGFDVYFAPATFADKRRVADQVEGIQSLYIDIDCGEGKPYTTVKEGLAALLQWCQNLQVARPSAIVFSGRGLHAYWALDRPYPRDEWLPVAQHFKQALAAAGGGLQVDAACTADAARVLRVPGTHNRKDPDNPQPVKVLECNGQRMSLQAFQAQLPKVGPIAGVGSGPKPASEWDVPAELPPGDAPRIAESCQQMGEIRKERGNVPEPFWRAGLSVLQRCEDAEHYIKEWSQGDPRYDPEQALEKARRTAGPATCQHFQDTNPAGCAGCPHAGKITSPIQLGVGAPEEPEKKDGGPPIRDLNQFKVFDTGIYFQPPPVEGQPPETPWRISKVPIWVEEVREKARGGIEADESALLMAWVSVDHRKKYALLRQREVYDQKAFKSWLADHNLISAVVEVKFLVQYISQYSMKMLQTQGAREYHENLGWYNGGFVLGDRIMTADGPEEALVQGSNPIARLQAKGSVEQWKLAAAVFEKPEYWMHAFSVMCGFGSPLLQLVGAQSAVVSLVGPSGAGKTLAANTALSIYGDPQHLGQGSSATANAWEQQLGCNRHVPFLLDEVTQFTVKRLTEFVYMAANGQGKASLTRTRETREASNWSLVPFITSNHPVLEFNQRDIEEAHRRRILELAFPGSMGSEDGAVVDSVLRENHGVAADPYLRYIIKIQDKIPQMFEQAVTKLQDQYGVPPANRFGLWTIASAMVGGAIAKALGLINYDIDSIIGPVARTLHGQAEATLLDSDRAQNAIVEWLTEHSKQVSYWAQTDAVGQPVDDPVARIYSNGTIAIHRSKLNNMLQEERLSKTQLAAWMDSVKASDDRRARLAPGTAPVWAYIFDTGKLGFDEGDLDHE